MPIHPVPQPRSRSRRALTLEEREQILLGLRAEETVGSVLQEEDSARAGGVPSV